MTDHTTPKVNIQLRTADRSTKGHGLRVKRDEHDPQRIFIGIGHLFGTMSDDQAIRLIDTMADIIESRK